jgi:hypothetical protein
LPSAEIASILPIGGTPANLPPGIRRLVSTIRTHIISGGFAFTMNASSAEKAPGNFGGVAEGKTKH